MAFPFIYQVFARKIYFSHKKKIFLFCPRLSACLNQIIVFNDSEKEKKGLFYRI